jgi:16S rRNA (guanine(1405)-N(7))-methyltransferase
MDALNPQLTEIIEAVQKKPKYRTIHTSLIELLAFEELAKGRKFKEAVKEVSSRLHQVGAAYFTSQADYSTWQKELISLPHDPYSPEVKAFCLKRMQIHSSTKERLPILEEFFTTTLAGIAPVESILDLACGLNPLALPWMPLSEQVQYYGCDIFSDLTGFLNAYLAHCGITGAIETSNLTQVRFPHQAKVAFLLKTLPCLEQLDKGISGQLLDTVPADYLLVSYPIRSLGGRTKGMGKTYESQFFKLMEGRNCQVTRFEFRTELAFLVKK